VCPKDGAALIPGSGTAELVNAPTQPGMPAAKGTEAAAATAAAPAPAAAGPSEAFDSLVGATLAGRYLIVRRIGEGGMGAVYEAKHTLIGKRVAVKVLLEKFISKSDFVARLLQEARLASSIGHENIVDVTDFGTTDDGRSFVVMEFLDGESLAQLVIREAPLPVERSLRIARQVASALGAAHAKGIYHRDVKPENVYLVRRGDADFVKVVDFGISKAVKQGTEDPAEQYRLTHTGLLLGTPLYMSPEQARGEEDLDHRVDIWALGVMLYECLTGEVPFRANNYLGIISQVLTHEAPPPSQLRPELGIPDAVESVVMRAMDKERARRYQVMADLQRDVERLLSGDQNVGLEPALAADAAPRGPVAQPRRWPLGLAAALALAGGVALALARPPGGRAAAVPVVAAPLAAPAPARPPAAPAAPPAALGVRAAAPLERPAKPAPARRLPRPEHKSAGADTANNRAASEPVRRGLLSPHSPEAYPEQ
jgi:eukaryotic-like serine/threonine-protein kinase